MLGSRKLLIFGIVSALVLSLLIVGSFAAEPEEFKEAAPILRSVVYPNSVVPQSDLFGSLGYYTVRLKVAGNDALFNGNFPTSDVSVYAFGINGTTNSFYVPADGNMHTVRRDGNFIIIDNVNRGVVGYMDSCAFSMADDSFELGSLWSRTLDSVEGSLSSGAQTMFATILGIGTSLVAFVVARPIVLIPIVAMILVLSFGVIRRFIKGV